MRRERDIFEMLKRGAVTTSFHCMHCLWVQFHISNQTKRQVNNLNIVQNKVKVYLIDSLLGSTQNNSQDKLTKYIWRRKYFKVHREPEENQVYLAVTVKGVVLKSIMIKVSNPCVVQRIYMQQHRVWSHSLKR